MKKMLRSLHLNTVCQSAGCPNITECFKKPTVTFMILGNVCTRDCRFCGVQSGHPESVDYKEPVRIAEAVNELNLKHVVITSVTRDDLPDGGAKQFADTVREIQRARPAATIEVLVPDFKGDWASLGTVLNSKPDILNHNVETVPRLYASVCSGADFIRSVSLLKQVKLSHPDIITKSGLMAGLGESRKELNEVFSILSNIGCDMLTIGQYLSPSLKSYPVMKYVTVEEFEAYAQDAKSAGILHVQSGPFVRSSYNAAELMQQVQKEVV